MHRHKGSLFSLTKKSMHMPNTSFICLHFKIQQNSFRNIETVLEKCTLGMKLFLRVRHMHLLCHIFNIPPTKTVNLSK